MNIPRAPSKVMMKAMEWGAHNDCLLAGAFDVDKACDKCQATIEAAFQHYYGELPTRKAFIDAVTEDVLSDLRDEDDRQGHAW